MPSTAVTAEILRHGGSFDRAAELVSVLGNRAAKLSRLEGDGVEVLAFRVSSMDLHLWEVDDD
jgi:hypothetical protein